MPKLNVFTVKYCKFFCHQNIRAYTTSILIWCEYPMYITAYEVELMAVDEALDMAVGDERDEMSVVLVVLLVMSGQQLDEETDVEDIVCAFMLLLLLAAVLWAPLNRASTNYVALVVSYKLSMSIMEDCFVSYTNI